MQAQGPERPGQCHQCVTSVTVPGARAASRKALRGTCSAAQTCRQAQRLPLRGAEARAWPKGLGAPTPNKGALARRQADLQEVLGAPVCAVAVGLPLLVHVQQREVVRLRDEELLPRRVRLLGPVGQPARGAQASAQAPSVTPRTSGRSAANTNSGSRGS